MKRPFGLVFFLLFPLAYIGGWLLERMEETPARMENYQDRAMSIETAEKFAASKGFDLAGWHQYAISESREALIRYYEQTGDRLSEIAPAREIQVLFRSPDQSREFRVYLSLTGQVIGYDFGKSTSRSRSISSDFGGLHVNTETTVSHEEETNEKGATDHEAESIARRVLAKNEILSEWLVSTKPEISTDSDDPARREVIWNAASPNHPELTVKATVGVRDGRVVSEHFEANLDKAHSPPKHYRTVGMVIVYSCFLTFAALYAIYRYAKRTIQKEVSHARTLVVAALFWVSYSVLAYTFAVDQMAMRVNGQILSQINIVSYIFALLTFAIMGLLVGIGYGSGEGEMREAFPGKLTSLDALLAGKIFSKDVAASLLFGAAAAGWLLLIHRGLSTVIDNDIDSTRSGVMTYTFSRLPYLSMIIGKQYDALLVAVPGLLLPAAFLVRRGLRKKRQFAWLIVFAIFSVLRDASKYPGVGAELLSIAVYVAALLVPFFAYDLLAAMVSVSAFSFVDQLVRLAAVFPSWSGFSLRLAALAAFVLAIATYLALRGEPVNEDEVRPRYAKNLAERMSLQAEVRAAREAQLRLLPQTAPEIPGLEIAACCLPARGVGGDFYDFFPLDHGRLGIFVAQGGDQGLASALCIALAKGLLMHNAQLDRTPAQIVIDLQASISELLEHGISYAYGVLDTRSNTLSYARLGDWPRFVVRRQSSEITYFERATGTIHEGSVEALSGDVLIFFTKGVASLRKWLDLSTQPGPLQYSLLTALGRQQARASSDLTAVMLRIGDRS